MELKHLGKKFARVLPLALAVVVSYLLSSCHNAPQATPVQCAIRIQAQVAIPNSVGVTQTYNQGGVGVAGSWQSDSGISNCTGSLHNFTGTTAYGTGLYEADGVKMNANWLVAWDWSNTNFSACPPYSAQQFVPDSGAVFDDVCHF